MSLLSNPRPLAFVMNAPVATNFSVANGLISISGLTDAFPKFSTLRLLTDGLEESQVAQTSNFSVAFTAANTTTYALNVTGVNTLTGLTEARKVSFTSDATGTAAEIAAALVNLVNSLPFGATATGSGTPVTISGAASLVVVNAGNTTVTSGNATIAPNATASTAITQSIAPNGTAATAVAGSTTVTVTTAAAHGLLPGDVVDLAGAATFLFIDARPGANQTAAATASNVIVATVPSTTTFTLQGVLGNGGSNSGTLTITTKNVVTVTTLAAHGLSVGNAVNVSAIATLTVNGGASFTSLVRSVPATDKLVLLGAGNGSTNSGTIVITRIAQPAKGYNYGTKVGTGVNSEWRAADGSAAVTANQGYTLLGLEYANDVVDSISIRQAQSQQVYILLNEGATGYAASVKALQEILNNWAPNTTLANPASVAP
jgi:hypothetical protein